MNLALTGHRPPRLRLSYSEADRLFLVAFARRSLSPFLPGVKKVYGGAAQGWDLAAMEAALSLNVPVVAAIPFRGHESKWPPAAQERYRSILARCAEVRHFGDHYKKSLFVVRDHWMVENGEELLALYDGDATGDTSGGTALTVKYARSLGRPVTNVWDEWKASLNARQAASEEMMRDWD